jgi:hypothetical protein
VAARGDPVDVADLADDPGRDQLADADGKARYDRGVAELWTMKGKPLRVEGDDIFDRSGRHVGRRDGDKVFAPDGRYAGTIVGDVVVYRSAESAHRGSVFAPSRRARSADANRVGSSIAGREPFV